MQTHDPNTEAATSVPDDAHMSLSQRLLAAAEAIDRDRVALHDLIEAQGSTGALGALMTLLAVPCLIPSMGIGWVLALGLFAIALAMLLGSEEVRLPDRVGRIEVSKAIAQRLLKVLASIYRKAERIARPRWTFLTDRAARRWLALSVFAMAFIIFLPIPGGNTPPAMTLVLLGPALMFRDGLVVLISVAASGLVLALMGGLVGGIIWAAVEFIR